MNEFQSYPILKLPSYHRVMEQLEIAIGNSFEFVMVNGTSYTKYYPSRQL